MGIVVLAVLSIGPKAWAAQIVRIEIRGLQAVDEETVRALLVSKVGDEYSEESVREDIHALYASGFIEDVQVESYDEAGGVVLVYIVKEKPIVNEVRFEGNKKMNKEELQALCELKSRSVYDANKVNETKAKIIEEYSKKGYFMVQVEVRVVDVGPNLVDVVFEIHEGKMPTVKDIKFFGNTAFTDQELRRRMTTKPEGVLTAKKYSREDFLRDQYVLDYFYDDNGYIEASFDPPERVISEDRENVYLSMSIHEGVQFFVGTIQVVGELIVPEEDLKSGFQLKEGEVFRKSQFMSDQQYLLDRYGAEGYALAQIEPDLNPRREDQRVDVTWRIARGSKVYIERILISGNARTYDKVIRRELVVKEGQLYNTAEVRRSEGKVKQLGYFEDVQIAPRPGSGPNSIDLEVTVKERQSGSFVFGAGVTTESEYFFSLQYNQQNFLGMGTDFSLQSSISQRTQNYQLHYADPYFLDTNWYLGADAFSNETYYVSFIDRRVGGSVTLGRRLPHLENVRFYATYSFLTTDLTGYDTDTIYRKQPSNANIGRISLALDRNNLNNNLDPTDGSRQRLEVQMAGYGVFGGPYDFVKSSFETWWFEPVYRGSYLSAKTRVRLMSYDNQDRLLISERYFEGGSRSLRGYENGAVSPMFQEDDGSLTPIGGNKDVLVSLEYIVPLPGDMGMKLALFYDTGNVYNDNQNIDLGDLRQDWGVSLRWMSPMGPLSFGIAFPIDPGKNDDPQQFVFSMGGAL